MNYKEHLIANMKVAANSFKMMVFHALHGIIPCKYTSHDYWAVNDNSKDIKTSEFIPCKERLPENKGYYWATVKESGSPYSETGTSYYIETVWYSPENGNGWYIANCRKDNPDWTFEVTAWMERAKPYKGD
jgi:hypothetical protein